MIPRALTKDGVDPGSNPLFLLPIPHMIQQCEQNVVLELVEQANLGLGDVTGQWMGHPLFHHVAVYVIATDLGR